MSVLEMTLGQWTPGVAERLSCVHNDDPTVLKPEHTSGTAGLEVKADGHMSVAYSLMDAALPKWDFFDYDWRLDMRWSGQLLADHLTKEAAGGDRWHIVTHSQGGLILLRAASILTPTVFQKLVHSVVFVGVPFFGCVNALEALLTGVGIGKIPPRVARTWPAIYQMLPRWNVLDDTKIDANLLTNTAWIEAGLMPTNIADLDLDKHIDPRLLRRAHFWDRDAKIDFFEPLRDIHLVRVVNGNNLETGQQVPQFPTIPGPLVMGDTLVPTDLTLNKMPKWAAEEANIKRFRAATHMLLCSDRDVYRWCAQ
ncbi:MAG: alpha/beta fold hydrolase [Deltaproteobacteria bacterium]|nr:alpha/beta fold hydrolase [Deltaproteobacteria bacterium]